MTILTGGVAFFDSGIGGLNVLSACLPSLRGTPVYYYGDNANAPYGNKPKKELAPFVFAAFDTFAALQVSAAVIACNTVTALFIDELRARYSFPIIGTEPAIRPAAKRGGECFVLATKATVNSTRMRALAKRTETEFQGIRVRLLSCGKLAGEIERHVLEEGYDFTPCLPVGKPRTVVLGCTHYGYIQKTIERFYGCQVLDGKEGIVKRLVQVLPFSKKSAVFSSRLSLVFTERKTSIKIPRFLKHFTPEKTKKTRKLKFAQPLYFLGSGRFLNADFYKQMFAFNSNG